MRDNYELVEPRDAFDFLDRGYRALDPHLHTAFSRDVIPSPNVHPAHLYRFMKAKGWGFVTFTDHDSLDGYKSFAEPPQDLVRGVEIKIRPKRIGSHTHTHTLHVNVYQLSDRQFEDLETLAGAGEYYAFIDYLISSELPYALNHPFWYEVHETPNWAIVPEVLGNGDFPLIEYNWGRIPGQNEKVLEMARLMGVPVWGASDNHVGKPEFATLVKGDSFEEAWRNAVRGQARIVRQHRTTSSAQMIPITDDGSYAGYVTDIITSVGWQLINVTSKSLKEKPVILDSATGWRNLLLKLATSGTIDKFCRITSLLGRVAATYGTTIGPALARPYVRSQEEELEAIADVIDPLLADLGADGEYRPVVTVV